MKDINKIIDSLSPGEQNVMYNALRVKLDKKPEYTISKDEHGYYVSSDKRMFGTFRFEKKEYAELAYQIWHLKRDVLTFQRVICLARNRTFREEDYSPLLNLFLKWQKTI